MTMHGPCHVLLHSSEEVTVPHCQIVAQHCKIMQSNQNQIKSDDVAGRLLAIYGRIIHIEMWGKCFAYEKQTAAPDVLQVKKTTMQIVLSDCAAAMF